MTRVSIFLIMVALIAGMAGCGGSGSAVEIRTWYDLDDIRDARNLNYVLMNDLDSTTAGYEELASPTANGGKGWDPIGGHEWADQFFADFDGSGYKICDLFIDRPLEDNIALFGRVGQGALLTPEIRNVGVVNFTVTGNANVAGLVGGTWQASTVANCYATGTVTGELHVGGLMGLTDNGNSVTMSHFTGTVTGGSFAGGLVGWNDGAVTNCWATGSVTGHERVGGLVGKNQGTVSNSYSAGSVTGDWWVGGLVGKNQGTVSNSYSTGSVTGDSWAGGLVGGNYDGTVSHSYSTGNVTGDSGIGGLVGFNQDGTVSNSYYNYHEALINGENIVTVGALFGGDFEQWLANDKFLDINERLSQENGYHVVNNVTDFKQLLVFGQDNSLKFRLTSDLDLVTEPNFYIPYLAGEFDGNGHNISNLSFSFDFVSQVGLFGYLSPGGTVTRVGVDNVNMIGNADVGGLVGSNEGTVINSYATSSSVTGNDLVGGLVGWNEGTIRESYATGNLTSGGCGGGLVGFNYLGTVSESYATSSLTGDDDVGGLVGVNWIRTLSNSYSTGNVAGSEDVGGLVGFNNGGTVSGSFWDTETSATDVSDGGTGKTTAEMQDIATFSGATWDIVAVDNSNDRNTGCVWNIVHTVTYPFLSWQPVP